MTHPMKAFALLFLLVLAGCARNSHHYTVKEVEAALRSGKVDRGRYTPLGSTPSLAVRELTVPGVSLQLFAFEDRDFTDTLVVDGSDLVLVYSGPKGSVPYDYHLAKENSLWVLTFKFKLDALTGDHAVPGRYVLTNSP